MWKRFYFKPFEAFVGLFVIINGWLTMFPIAEGGSAVRDNLWNIMGYPGIAVPIFQIIAGLLKILGIAFNKANVEAAGLVMVSSIFLIRIISLVSDWNITNSDINNIVIAIGIIISNVVKLVQLSNNHGYVITEVRLKETP